MYVYTKVCTYNTHILESTLQRHFKTFGFHPYHSKVKERKEYDVILVS